MRTFVFAQFPIPVTIAFEGLLGPDNPYGLLSFGKGKPFRVPDFAFVSLVLNLLGNG